MNSTSSPGDKRSKMLLMQTAKSLGSFLSHSTNYWKGSFDANFCCPRRDNNEDMTIHNDIEDKKDLFKVVSNEDSPRNFNSTEIAYRKEWSKRESELLIGHYYNNKVKNWKKLSSIIQTKSPQQCCYRIKRLEEKAKINSFTKQDDIKISRMVDLYGKDWEKIARALPNFTANLIEDRYNSKLDPYLKRTKFSSAEDEKILGLYEQFGNNWKEIASHFVDRNANMVKNRFYSVLKKKVQNSNSGCSSSCIDSHSIVNSILPLSSFEENGVDPKASTNMRNKFVFPMKKYMNHNVVNAEDNCGDMITDPNLAMHELNIEMKANAMYENDTDINHDGLFQEESGLNNNTYFRLETFNEIYQRVFQNDIERKRDIEHFGDNLPFLSNDPQLFFNNNSLMTQNKSHLFFSEMNDSNGLEQSAKINQTDALFIESQRLEEILANIDGEQEIINDDESLSNSIGDHNPECTDFLHKKDKLAKYKDVLYVKLKQLQNDYQQLKSASDDLNVPHKLRQTLLEINEVLLKLISLGKMKIILKKQIYDYHQERLSNGYAFQIHNDTHKDRK